MSNKAYHETRMALPEHVRAQVPLLSSLLQERQKTKCRNQRNYYSRGIHLSGALRMSASELKTLTLTLEHSGF